MSKKFKKKKEEEEFAFSIKKIERLKNEETNNGQILLVEI